MSPLLFLLLLFLAFGLFGLISDRSNRVEKIQRVSAERRVTLKDFVVPQPLQPSASHRRR